MSDAESSFVQARQRQREAQERAFRRTVTVLYVIAAVASTIFVMGALAERKNTDRVARAHRDAQMALRIYDEDNVKLRGLIATGDKPGEVARLREQLASAQSAWEEEKAALDATHQAEVDQLRRAIAEMPAGDAHLRDQVTTLTGELASVRKELAAVKAENGRLADTVARQKRRIEDLSKVVDPGRIRPDRLRDDIRVRPDN